MKLGVVVEGRRSEHAVYRSWIPLLNPALRFRSYTSFHDLESGEFTLISGEGYPQYLEIIRDAAIEADEVGDLDRLVVAVDSETMSLEEKREEMVSFLGTLGTIRTPVRLIIQHFCLECWALGNRKIVRRSPLSAEVRRFRKIHDVLQLDPADLPPIPPRNRAQLAEVYLRALLLERYRNLSYSKRDPGPVATEAWLTQLRLRWEETGHIASIRDLFDAFR